MTVKHIAHLNVTGQLQLGSLSYHLFWMTFESWPIEACFNMELY